MHPKIRCFTEWDHLEGQAREQIEQTAHSSVVEGVAVMADAHFGKGSTVGTVIATSGAVIPAAVGVDIGCGMAALRFGRVGDMPNNLLDVRNLIEAQIPMGARAAGTNKEMTYSAISRAGELERLALDLFGDPDWMDHYHKDWRLQLGSLGGGNHFIEVSSGDDAETCDNPTALMDRDVWYTIHSGSRGVGNQVGQHWMRVAIDTARKYRYFDSLPNPDLAYLVEGTGDYELYLKEVTWCQKYALLNREEMLSRFLSIKDAVQVIHCHHNFAQIERHDGKNLLITRKGAISAREGEWALIPGSMATPSYIVTGKGNRGSYMSAPHGAGRKMSRRAARNTFNIEELTALMKSKNIEADIRPSILDEHPDSYKDIRNVIFESHEQIEPIYKLLPMINIKGDS